MTQTMNISPGKLNVIYRQLCLILHSKRCTEECPNSFCDLMKRILIHMKNCSLENRCPLRYCRSSRQIFSHWESRRCGRLCPVCIGISEAGVKSNPKKKLGKPKDTKLTGDHKITSTQLLRRSQRLFTKKLKLKSCIQCSNDYSI